MAQHNIQVFARNLKVLEFFIELRIDIVRTVAGINVKILKCFNYKMTIFLLHALLNHSFKCKVL